jgi:hypothetical protein
MDTFRLLYLLFGSFVCLSGLTMIGFYTASFPWWRDTVGRMMVIYAATEVAMSSVLLLAVVVRVGPHWFRGLWFILQIIVGVCFTYQTLVIYRLRKNRVSLTKERERA